MSRIFPAILSAIVLIVLIAIGAVTIMMLKPKPEQADEVFSGLSVFAKPIVREDLSLSITSQGEVRPRREIVVAAQVGGRIAYVSPDFIDGGFIRKGQTLVRLEGADYELAVVRARAGVASAEQKLALEQAEAELARQDLKTLGIVDSSPLARREPQLAEAQAALDSAKAQLADAELALRRTTVTAPFSGRVREETVEVGQLTSVGQSLGRIFATDRVEVVLPITDGQLGRLGLPMAFAETDTVQGPSVTFTGTVAGQARVWSGRVVRTAATVNPRTRLINVIAELRDPYGEGADNEAPMAPGLFVQARIDGVRVDDLLVTPRAAVRSGNKLFIGDPETGVLRILEVDLIHADTEGAWFRSSQVKPGDMAVISPLQAPNDGMKIVVLERMPDGSIKDHNLQTAKTQTGSSPPATGAAPDSEADNITPLKEG